MRAATSCAKGDVIAYIESGADYRDILLLDSLLRTGWLRVFRMDSLPGDLILGDVGPSYNSFMVAYAQHCLLIRSDIYGTMRRNLAGKIALDEQIVDNLAREIELKEQAVDSTCAQLKRDSLLVMQNALTVAEYQQQRNNCLALKEALLTLQNSRLSKQSEIAQNRLEIQRITLEENEAQAKTFSEMTTARNALENAINVWTERYLQYAPIDGELEYLGFWRENSFCQFRTGALYGHRIKATSSADMIPAQGAGKGRGGTAGQREIAKIPLRRVRLFARQGELHFTDHEQHQYRERNHGYIPRYRIIPGWNEDQFRSGTAARLRNTGPGRDHHQAKAVDRAAVR